MTNANVTIIDVMNESKNMPDTTMIQDNDYIAQYTNEELQV